jgi:LysM repeat protein
LIDAALLEPPTDAPLAPRMAWAPMLLVAIMLLGGCGAGGLAPVDSRGGSGPAPPGYYRVRRGDTLSEIAERKRISTRTLAAWNRLSPPYTIYSGGLLRVKPPAGVDSGASRRFAQSGQPGSKPGRKQQCVERSRRKPVKTSARKSAVVAGADGPSSGINWQWPVRGPIKQGFWLATGPDRASVSAPVQAPRWVCRRWNSGLQRQWTQRIRQPYHRQAQQ